VLLFRGKATLLRKHWSPLRRTIGLGLLLAGVGIRALLARKSAWPAVWAARGSWIDGYAPVARPPAVEAEASAG
jgi:N-acetylglucosaminyl-diphospho-decaprenol L-rhamnosyltransferase